MMDGMAASITAVLRGDAARSATVRQEDGDAKRTGTAMIKAMAEVSSVPMMGTTAP